MIAAFDRSRLRTIRSPRLVKPLMSGSLALRRGRRRGEIGAAAGRDELTVLVEHVRLGAGELPAGANDLALGGEVARHGGGVIVDAQVDGRHRASELLD